MPEPVRAPRRWQGVVVPGQSVVPAAFPIMLNRFKKILFSVPSITVVGVFSAYPLLRFFVLPAVLKWQLEKQLAERGP